ncbi:MAG: hypothetical protein M1457_08725 [bacterium]|nr:hypothetical protein [bacterium]
MTGARTENRQAAAPEEKIFRARQRLRAAAADIELRRLMREHAPAVVGGALGVGLVLGYYPGLARALGAATADLLRLLAGTRR